MKRDLLQKAIEAYQNAILFYNAGQKDDFYRYLGNAEAFEYTLRMHFILTDEEINRLRELADACDEYEEK